jgi:hypothetical protein
MIICWFQTDVSKLVHVTVLDILRLCLTWFQVLLAQDIFDRLFRVKAIYRFLVII